MTRRKMNSRSSSVVSDIESLDPQLQRDAKRIQRQQKQLEKKTGIATITPISARQRMIKLEDIVVIDPLTDTQRDVFDAFENPDNMAFVLYGSAGTGKTFLAVYQALLDVLDPKTPYAKIIIVRSAVASRDTGFLPGTQDEKMAVYEQPYYSIFSDLTGKKDAYEKLKECGKIEFMSTSYLRGSTFNNAIVVFDEVQSENWHGISTVMTRIGKDCRVILCGDYAQSDLIKTKNDTSGFRELMQVASKMNSFSTFKFTPDDIVRSGFVKQWLITCEKLGL